MDVFHLGPLTIRYDWLYILVAFTVAYFVSESAAKTDSTFQKEFLDAFTNSILISIFVYKFSILFLRPSILVDNPLGIVYFWGGRKGLVMSFTAVFFYLFWKKKKVGWPQKLFHKTVVCGIVTFAITFYSLRTLFNLLL